MANSAGNTRLATTSPAEGFGIPRRDATGNQRPRRTEALALLQRDYNPHCQPPWSEKELLHKVKDAAGFPHEKEYGWLLKTP